MRVHPAAGLFAMLREVELARLAEDIRRNGLLHAIVTLDGAILDGRNRLAACALAGVRPRYEEWRGAGSPVTYVIGANVHRRHLTPLQRAAVAVESLPLFEAEARQRQRAAGVHGAMGGRGNRNPHARSVRKGSRAGTSI